MKDSNAIVSSMHNHTAHCDGLHSPREMIEAALTAGITDFGLSAHSYAPFDLPYAVRDERGYIDEVTALKAEYAGRINVYLGTETDLYAPPQFPSDYDYTIASTHYVKADGEIYTVDGSPANFERALQTGFGGDKAALCAAYFENVCICATSGADILGHFDLLRKCGRGILDLSADYYVTPAFRALDAVIQSGIVIELNYGGVVKSGMDEPYPAAIFLEALRRADAPVTVSTDCHNKALIARGLPEGRAHLKRLGFTNHAVYHKGKFISVAL